ncbi:hypothetical protein CHUAL_013344 [Chamberlinius hualienensis]
MDFLFWFSVYSAAIIWILIWIFSTPSHRLPICGVYRQIDRFYPLKFAIAYLLLTLRKYGNKKAADSTAGYGVKSKKCIEDMEKPQPLSDNPKAIDAVYISGFNKEGCYFVTAIGRGQKQLTNAFWFLRIPKVGLLKASHLPDSRIKANGDSEFSVGGLTIQPVEPMKKWKITYDGKMKFEKDEEKEVHVRMNLEFTSSLPYFDFDTDMPPATMARALAREPWSKQLLERLKEAHQTHYEQMGFTNGVVSIDGYGSYTLGMSGYRDHSYGKKREWKYMHRYGLHSVALQNGTLFTVGIVSQPINLSVLEIGYLYTPCGDLYGIDWCDLELDRHGEGGEPPNDYAFSFGAGGQNYRVQVKVVDLSQLDMGIELEARFVERFCEFTVNGLRGWGISEWQYKKY